MPQQVDGVSGPPLAREHYIEEVGGGGEFCKDANEDLVG